MLNDPTKIENKLSMTNLIYALHQLISLRKGDLLNSEFKYTIRSR